MNFKLSISTILVVFLAVNLSFCVEEEKEDEEIEGQFGSGKIVGGSLITIDAVPYFASILYKNKHLCGASIISDQWLISAAHCYVDGVASNYKIRTGSSRKSRTGAIQKVEKLIKHQLYSDSTLNYDFMLIKLAQKIKFNKLQKAIPLAAANKIIAEGIDVRTCGFGLTNNPRESDEFLRVVVVQTSNQEFCTKAYDNFINEKNMLCAGSTDGKDSCQVRMLLNFYEILLILIYFRETVVSLA